MPRVTLIKPLDQPLGRHRLLADLNTALRDERFSSFRLVVAYAKSGPLHRIRSSIEQWRAAGKTIEAIFGIDQQGTSQEALELSLALFNNVYITRERGITFHPKLYLFAGASAARLFIGSNNLTVGGTEKNFEAGVLLDLDLPTEAATFAQLEEAWTELLPGVCPATSALTGELLTRLVSAGEVIDERAMRRRAIPAGGEAPGRISAPRSGLIIVPESPLPLESLAGRRQPTPPPQQQTRPVPAAAPRPVPARIAPAVAQGFAIQIKPHHNGEIFMSVIAVSQNPQFFRWPFTGSTIPKKAGNPSYPQLTPDPVVNITVYGGAEAPILALDRYALNTVYYETKSEIRVTASPLVGIVPEYSVMVIRESEQDGVDYDMTIYTPVSPDYPVWVAACNQSMPSGGKVPRKFGWF